MFYCGSFQEYGQRVTYRNADYSKAAVSLKAHPIMDDNSGKLEPWSSLHILQAAGHVKESSFFSGPYFLYNLREGRGLVNLVSVMHFLRLLSCFFLSLLFLLIWFFETRVFLYSLGWPRTHFVHLELALISQISVYLCLKSADIKDICHHSLALLES